MRVSLRAVPAPRSTLPARRRRLATTSLCLVWLGLSAPPAAQGQLAPSDSVLAAYLRAHWQSPEDYVMRKFADHDVVFVGEMHRIRHDVEFIHRLIPRLHAAGIDLGIEFARHVDQPLIDSLLSGRTYDEALAREIQFRQFVGWGYREYMDIFRVAWALNRSLPAGARPFRVVGIGYIADFAALQESGNAAQEAQVWAAGPPDEQMARVVLDEFVATGRKALVYCGIHHAFTRFRQPAWDYAQHRFTGVREPRLGNLVHARSAARVFTVVLHAPWLAKSGPQALALPAGGVIDRVIGRFPSQRVGFDVVGSPFGALPDTATLYSAGSPAFTLETFADGYVFQGPLSAYEGVTVDPLFITPANLARAIANTPNPAARRGSRTAADFLESMRRDADVRQRFRGISPEGAPP